MKPSQRMVVNIPLQEIWNERGVVSTTEVRKLSVDDIANLLRRGKLRCVVANVGLPLHWVSLEDCYEFWKTEVRMRVADPSAEHTYREAFPGRYFYFASEWSSEAHEPIVLLTAAH